MNFCPYCQLPLEAPVAQCPSCYADLTSVSSAPPPPGRGGGTFVESVQGVRDAVNQIRSTGTVIEATANLPVSQGGSDSESPAKPADDGTVSFRPIRRVPTIKICVLDDGNREQGDWYRIRKPNFVIGRREGDIIVPHDDDISGRHLEINTRVVDGQYRFFIKDLGSTNGSFIRIARLMLRKDQEVLIGAKRYRFEPGSMEGTQVATPAPAAAASTRGWQAVDPKQLTTLFPALVEITPQGPGQRYELRNDDQLMGRHPQQCQLVINNDPFVSPVHVRIRRDKKNRWMMENMKSLNGIWLRFGEVPIDTDGELQLGEQRFLIRFPPRA